MSDRIKELIKEQFDNLPPVIQDAITKSHWEDSLRNIVERHRLHIDQGTDIENQTLLTMLGFEDSEDYVENLISHANLPENKAVEIAKEVEVKIFSLIRNQLIKNTDEEDEDIKKGPLEEKISRTDILRDIENPPPSVVPTRQREVPIQKVEEKIVPTTQTPRVTPETTTPKASQTLETRQTTDEELPEPPVNLPVGDISKVPPHGHDHSMDLFKKDTVNSYSKQSAEEKISPTPSQSQVFEVKQTIEEKKDDILFKPKPIEPEPQDIIKDKLQETFISSKEILVKNDTAPLAEPKTRPDPYREQF